MIKDFDNSVALPRTNGSFFIGAVTRSTRCRLLRLIQQQNDLDSECFLREPIEQITLKGAALLLGSITKELSQKSTSNGLFKEMLTKVSTIACLQTQWCWLVLGDTLPETTSCTLAAINRGARYDTVHLPLSSINLQTLARRTTSFEVASYPSILLSH